MYKGTHKIRLMLFTNGTISISGLNIELIYEYTNIIQSFIEIVYECIKNGIIMKYMIEEYQNQILRWV